MSEGALAVSLYWLDEYFLTIGRLGPTISFDFLVLTIAYSCFELSAPHLRSQVCLSHSMLCLPSFSLLVPIVCFCCKSRFRICVHIQVKACTYIICIIRFIQHSKGKTHGQTYDIVYILILKKPTIIFCMCKLPLNKKC